MKAVVMAGGFGTRLRPLTEKLPKPMAYVANRPMMEHVVRLLAREGITDLAFKLKKPLESPEPIPAGDPRKKPDEGAWPWIHILDANGWTIKGPQSRGG